MDHSEKWEIIRSLGEGGQGKVYLVAKKPMPAFENALRTALMEMTKSLGYNETREREYQEFRKRMLEMIRMEDPAYQGALKVLHKPENARDPDLARERIKREIEVMSKTLHPNLVQILDVDTDSEWYVSKYYLNGSLAEKRDLFKGDFPGAVKAIHPLVEAVAELHKRGYVHRDIKPNNVFIGPNNELVLGDFGLIYFADSQHTRVSPTYENVGSRDWMPGWAMGMRIDEVKSPFDVFSLGKLLWSMLSGQPILPLWYYDKPKFNVDGMFPSSNHIKFANRLFAKCIVEEEKDCLPDAMALLREINELLRIIESDADPIGKDIKRRCRVCGIGEYLIVDGSPSEFGLKPVGGRRMLIFGCSHCGHVQFFFFENTIPPAWRETKKR